jgi:hypothetical protein
MKMETSTLIAYGPFLVSNNDLGAATVGISNWINLTTIWAAELVDEVHQAFVEHPDVGKDDFITKLKGQMRPAAPAAQQLLAEMLWALLLFPSNMKAATKRKQVCEMWALSGKQLSDDSPLMRDDVLTGIGSGGPGFNNYRPDELTFLIAIVRDLKRRDVAERKRIFADYTVFVDWIKSVPREGFRQYRHMLRFFAFPDRVERMSSNRDRKRILDAYGIASKRETKDWTDQQLDDALFKLRGDLTINNPTEVMDFYASAFKDRWRQKVKTANGEVAVVVPDDEEHDGDATAIEPKAPEARLSFQIQAKLAEIGAIMGFKIWVPRVDRGRVRELVQQDYRAAFLEDDLPFTYKDSTLETIEQIDVLWIKRGSIERAFEVEHSTAVYSGLLRMADLLALQPNINIRLHIVAHEDRRDKVFHEMQRPVFSLLAHGPLSRSCTFISYDSVEAIRNMEHLAHTTDSIINEYEESAEA